MQRHLSRIMRTLSVGRMKGSSCSLWQPPVDMYQSETELIVCVEVAGIAPQEIKVMAESQALTISGERKSAVIGISHVHRLEIEYGRFACHLPLPVSINVENTRSEINNGFLLIRMPIIRHQGAVAL